MKTSDHHHVLTSAQMFARRFQELESIVSELHTFFKERRPKAKLTWVLEEALGFGVYIKQPGKPEFYLHAQIVGFYEPLEKQYPRISFGLYKRHIQGDLQFIDSAEQSEVDDLLGKIYFS